MPCSTRPFTDGSLHGEAARRPEHPPLPQHPGRYIVTLEVEIAPGIIFPCLFAIGAQSVSCGSARAHALQISRLILPCLHRYAVPINVEHCYMQLCWPFNTLVQTGSGYFLDFQADDVVLDGLGFNVEDDTLTLFTTASMESAFPVILVVSILSSLVLSMSNIALSWCCWLAACC